MRPPQIIGSASSPRFCQHNYLHDLCLPDNAIYNYYSISIWLYTVRMVTPQPNTINQLLSLGSGILARISRKSRQNIKLLKTIQSLLPTSLADECYSISSTNHRLIIHTSSPAWSNKLRFQLPSIQQSLAREHNLYFSDISVRTSTDLQKNTENPKENKRCHLSEKSADNIIATAAAVSDPSLKDALLRLAESHKLCGNKPK